MRDEDKTKEQLIYELEQLRQQIREDGKTSQKVKEQKGEQPKADLKFGNDSTRTLTDLCREAK